jgi:hypothetical protein
MQASEPIRLVCPSCDTVHRVKAVTMGKLYRCKKCRKGLVTMTPATPKCAACGFSLPAAHVEVSRLLTCPRCPSSPLLQIDFSPPSAAPMLHDVAAAVVATNSALEAAQATEAEPASASAPAAAQMSAAAGLAAPGAQKKEGVVQALQRLFDQMQKPLVQEIERTRRSVPAWLAALLSLPVIALIGALYGALLDAQAGTRAALERVGQREQEIRRMQDRLTQREKEMTSVQAEIRIARERMGRQEKELTATQANLNQMFEAWKQVRVRAEQMDRNLRALGRDPELKPAAARDEKPSP